MPEGVFGQDAQKPPSPTIERWMSDDPESAPGLVRPARISPVPAVPCGAPSARLQMCPITVKDAMVTGS